MSAATDAAVSASISTPVCAVVSADASDLDAVVADAQLDADVRERQRMAERDQLRVRFAAMIPASCAVVSASPFGSSPQPRCGLRRHPHDRARDGAAALRRLAADVDHPHRAGLVDVRQARLMRARSHATR